MAGKPRGKPFASGNPGKPVGAVSNKPWRDALQRVITPEKLEALAHETYRRAMDGDGFALKEIGLRLDGLPRQEITGEDGGPLTVTIKKYVFPGTSE